MGPTPTTATTSLLLPSPTDVVTKTAPSYKKGLVLSLNERVGGNFMARLQQQIHVLKRRLSAYIARLKVAIEKESVCVDE